MTDNHTNAVAGPSTDMPVDPDSVGAPNQIVPPPATPITVTPTAAAPSAHTPPVEIITPAMLGSIIATAVKTAIESFEQAKRWLSISMDFITGLPKRQHYDSILVVVDRFSKMVRLMPCRETISARQTACLLFDHVLCEHGLPESIISDRDIHKCILEVPSSSV